MQIIKGRGPHHAPFGWLAFLLLAFAAAFAPTRLFAQNSSSAVTGVVTDSKGAVVAGTKIVLQNVDTNVERETVSNASGNYFFTSIPPARYTLKFAAPSFQSQTVSAFDLGVAQTETINTTLTAGNVNESITVQTSSIQVESSTAQLGTVIGQQQVNNLPLNGRNFTQLLTLTPGVTPVSTGQNNGGGNTANISGSAVTFPSINGAGNRATIYLTDGMNNNQAWYNTYAVPPIIDQVAEFKINSHNDSVYGGSLGGVVNIVTVAGTNNYHGGAWELIRNNSFDANPFFKTVAKPSYHLIIFGGHIGGPVRVPHLYNGKDKTFFEIGLEVSHYSQSSATNYLEPTLAELGQSTWGGPQTAQFLDFSSAQTGAKGNCVAGAYSTGACQLYDPSAGGNSFSAGSNNYGPYRPAFLGNQIPVSKTDPHALAYIKAIFPNAPIVIPGIAPTTANQQITDPSRQTTYNYTGRIDQHIGDKDFIFVRYANFQSLATAPSTVPTLFGSTFIPAQQYGANWLHVFNPTTTMQVQYGRTHVGNNAVTTFNDHNLWQTYGCSADMCNSFVGGVTLLVPLTVTNAFSGGEGNTQTSNLSSVHEWSGSVSKTIGNHQIQAGGGWDQVNYTATLRQGGITFSGASTGNFSYNLANPAATVANPGCPAGTQCSTVPAIPDKTNPSSDLSSSQPGFGLADFLLNYPNTENKRNVLITERPGGIGNFYIQDSWKATPALTVNYGIRYDRSVIPAYGTPGSVGFNGSIETGDFDFNNGDYIIQQLPPLCSVRMRAPCLPSATLPAHVRVATGGKILHGSKDNFGPRLGVAYRVNDKLSVRAGFGIVYDNWAAIIQMTQNYQGSWPDTGTLQINNTNTPGTIYTSGQNPFASNGGNLPAATPFTSSNVGYMVDPRWKNPYSEQYNIGLEQQFGQNTLLALNYVGSASHRVDVGGYYNTGTPAAGSSFATRQTAGTTGQPYPYAPPEKSWDHSGASASYNALQAMFRGHTPGLQYMISYTWSKTLNEGGDGYFGVEGGVPQDPYNPKGSRGPASYSIPQLLAANFVYSLPIGTGKQFSTKNKVADYILGNWQVNGIITGRSGQNFNVTAAGDLANTGNGSTYLRANLVGNPMVSGPVSGNPGCTLYTAGTGKTKTAQQWFNPCAFVTPTAGTLGNAGRNILESATFWDVDASVFRIFPIRESLKVRANLETFNTLNHPVLGSPASTVTSSSTFGVITSTASKPRILQGSIKIEF